MLESTRPGGWDTPSGPLPAPLALHRTTVPAAWVDYNGHMSEWCYLLAMGDNSDTFFRFIGIDEGYRESGFSLYTVETHIRNLDEAGLGDDIHSTLRVLGVDAKRVHIAHEVWSDDRLLATGEQMLPTNFLRQLIAQKSRMAKSRWPRSFPRHRSTPSQMGTARAAREKIARAAIRFRPVTLKMPARATVRSGPYMCVAWALS